MTPTYDLILKNGVVANQDGVAQRDIAITKGRIVALGHLSHADAGQVIDCTGLHILPGVIDDQVHFREPGLDHKEDLETGSRAAVMGGVTAVFEMPNTDPQTTTGEALADKVKRGTHRMHCDFAFWVGGTHDNIKHLPELERLPGAAGIKVFMGSSTGSLLVEDDKGVEEILSRLSRRSAFHSEDEMMLRERRGLRIDGDPSSHPVWRSEEVALSCTERLVGLARKVGARVHVLHISTEAEIRYLADQKDVASCEITPHHLTMVYPAGCGRCAGFRSRPPYARRKGETLSGFTLGHDGCADACPLDARSHPCRTLDAGTLCRSDQCRSGPSVRDGPQRPHCLGL